MIWETALGVAIGHISGFIILTVIGYVFIKKLLSHYLKAVKKNPEFIKIREDFQSGRMFEHLLEKPEVKAFLDEARRFLDERRRT